ncbi:carbohydrate ABC transporter permease [Labrys wisconsinensis]|uniref:Raffinose/stachyose/melibiose transport system permease protein n=1 Tax=Labrys wisconsinensis TaxID=425677 RepID=A0ABU0JI93_9HYPH|nr:sugar ABC transporter permease [Labrys wisconsinensis]MDQ0473325.1 raffinose/stachyose/melibiose transport system permease protein [Labrys wisconsinensis]
MAAHAAPLARSNRITALVFLPPALAVFTVFVIMPVGEAAWYSLYNWDGYGTPSQFVGWRNYVSVLANPTFLSALANNGWIILASLAVQLPLALGLALWLAGRQVGTTAFRLIFFLPYILADVAAGLIWRFVFDGDYGLVSALAQGLGSQPVYMLADRHLAEVAVLTVVVWKYFGFHMMLYIAGLQGIDASLYEAARIDGAGAWQRFRYITLPQLGPMLRLSVFFSVIGSLQFFDMVIPLTGGGPFNSTHTMVSFLYSFGITRMRVGFGSAVGVILFCICVAFAFGYKRWFMRDD